MALAAITLAFWFGPALFAVGLNLAIANLERNPFTKTFSRCDSASADRDGRNAHEGTARKSVHVIAGEPMPSSAASRWQPGKTGNIFIPDSTTHSAPGGECRPETLSK